MVWPRRSNTASLVTRNFLAYIEANHQKFLKGDIKVLNFIVRRCAADQGQDCFAG